MSRGARAALVAAVAALIVPLAACAMSRGDPPPPVRVVGVRWEQFPDIPFPPGWKPLVGEDHVAIATAGDSLRRLRLAVQAPPARDDLQPDQAISRYVAALLPEHGWTRPDGGRTDAREQRWRKGNETLVVTATREDGLAVLRYRLEP